MIRFSGLIAAVVAFAVGTPALADDTCHDLWFTRNLVMDRAGYCFGSVLGKAVFDNAGCSGKSVSLDRRTQALVSRVRGLEKDLACKVDTAQPVLVLDDIDIRRRLSDLPVRDEFESACIGWRLDPLPLRSGHSAGAGIVGEIRRGDSVGFRHYAVDGWNYVTVTDRNWRLKSAGWTDAAFGIDDCEQFAG